MKISRQFCTFFLILIVMISGFSFCSEDLVFSDLENHWAEDLIMKKYSEGLVEGYPDGTFRPDEILTKGQLVAVINRSFGLSKVADNHFVDVNSDDWYKNEVDKAEYYDYIKGVALHGEEAATSKDAVIMVSRLLDLEIDEENMEIIDTSNLSPDEQKMFKRFAEMGYINDGSNRIKNDPNKKLNRAEILDITDNVLGYVIRSQKDVSNIPPGENITIVGQNISLDNVDVGNIYVSPGVYSGLEISNSVVKGKMNIVSDQLENSITLDNVKVNTMKISDKSDQLNLQLKGSTRIMELRSQNNGKISGDSNVRIYDVIVESGSQEYEDIVVKDDMIVYGGELSLKDTELNDVLIEGESQLLLDKFSEIKDLDVDAKANISGEGTIRDAYINTKGVNIEVRPQNTRVESGFTAEVSGKQVESKTYESDYKDKSESTSSKKKNHSSSSSNTVINPIKVVISGENTVQVGETISLSASIEPSNASNKNLVWASSNDAVAKVENGIVSGIAPGKVTIKVKTLLAGVEDTIDIDVINGTTPQEVFNIQFDPELKTASILGFTEEIIKGDNPSELIFKDYYEKDGEVYKLTSIGPWAFVAKDLALANPIEKVVFPNTLEIIGEGAFATNNITSLSIPDSVVDIRASAFMRNNISSLDIPASVVSVGECAFMDNSIELLTLNEGLEIIEDSTFYNNSIKEIYIPNTVIRIIGNAFRFNKIETLEIAESTEFIGYYAFQNIEGVDIKSIIINGEETRFNESWEIIGWPIDLMPIELYNIQVVPGPEESPVAVIFGFNEAVGDKYPEKLEFPSNFEKAEVNYPIFAIMESAFAGKSISEVIIPSSVEYLLENSFRDTKLTKISIEGDDSGRFNDDWESIGFPPELMPKGSILGIAVGNYKYERNDDYIAYINGLSNEGIESELAAIEIPEYVDLEGQNCKVIGIAEDAFSSARYDLPLVYTEVVIPETMRRIKVNAFYGSRISSITIPASVVTIEDTAFSKTEILESVLIEGDKYRFNDRWESIGFPISEKPLIEIGDLRYSNNGDGGARVEGLSKTGIETNPVNINIPSTIEVNEETLRVVSISEGAFALSNYEVELKYESVSISENIVTIREDAFKGGHIKELSIPSNINYLLNGSFADNADITSIEILGDEARFNDNWESIGFPIELKPSDPIDE